MKPCLLVSACLLGEPCRYDGASKPCESVLALSREYQLISVCPELLGGLSTPRVPCEIVGERVLRRDGADMTEKYKLGAESALSLARENHVICAILKNKSPSCGKVRYDGTFSRRLVAKPGVTTTLLVENGIPVFSEEEITDLGAFQKLIHKKR